jgi:uracil-DNA glycosylase
MGADQRLDWELAKSALNWWRDAGVDVLVDEAPRDWLAPVSESLAVERPAPTAAPRIAPAPPPVDVKLPETLDAFIAWRLSDAAPEMSWSGARIAPEGDPAARLMVLVDCPERDAPDTLLGGPAGKLFDAMLAAIGLDRATIYLAALGWCRPLGGRIPAESSARLAALARHHVQLAGPKRLLLLGNAASRALLGADVTPMRGSLQPLNHKVGQEQAGAVASYPPRFLLERPAAKAEAWRDLQLLVRGLA